VESGLNIVILYFAVTLYIFAFGLTMGVDNMHVYFYYDIPRFIILI